MLILSILTLESAHSICFLYKHFLSGITKQTLNAFNYVCSYEKVDYYIFMNTIVWIALKLIPDFVFNNGKNSYLSIPPGYRMWQKKSELDLRHQ